MSILIPLGPGASIAGPYANRHGLITGATGTGKTYTLATLAQGFSAAGVPVFMVDVKGDLAGLARGVAPVQFFDVYGRQGAPVTATVREMGADLLAKVLGLSGVQSEILGAIFATDSGRLDSLDDLKRRLARPSHEFRATRASLDSIARALITFRASGADSFFARPGFDIARLEAHSDSGAGMISILAADRLVESPALYGAVLLWLMGEIFRRAPEIGDVAKPRLVLIFDEAHLIFRDATPALLRRIESTVRLIRSRGVGVYFATQSPLDIPPSVAGQLSNRVQHAMRASTLADRREIQGAADCLPINPKIRAADHIATMPTGVALVSTLGMDGRPAPVQVVKIRSPSVALGPLTPDERAPYIPSSQHAPKVTPAGAPPPRWRVLIGGAVLCALGALCHAPLLAVGAMGAATLALGMVSAP